ncbi:MAG: cation diffusion facilitator family transporter, partial [Lachnospiraceae bacterium]|nr:cation diffusion facilitator family transporter [Lachnospiraceae bacterium]
MAEEAKKQSSRERIIIKTSVIGIAANIFLSAFKAAVGLASNSIAIVLDAVNNLSDALSSVITIIGTRLAGKPADKKHPFGHGRIEYITAMIIAVIVLYAGITSLLESVKKIIHPETAEYKVTALIIVAVAVIVKLVLGRYVFTVGKRVHSDSLIASGQDASFDAIISASTLVAALIFMFLHISLESWLGAAISIVIIKSGFEMLSDTIAEVLGKRVEPEIAETVKRMVEETPEVRGAYDLTLHNYGPEKLIGSVHVEVDEDVPISRIDEMSREIQHRVYE